MARLEKKGQMSCHAENSTTFKSGGAVVAQTSSEETDHGGANTQSPLSCDNQPIPSQSGNTTASASPQNSMSLEKFTLFPKLPIELRLKIWKESMPREPRVIEVL